MERIRVLFFGTPDFAIPSLTALAQDGDIEVKGVVTNLDRPAGRGMELQAPPVKTAAQNLGIPVYQTDTLKRDIILRMLGDALDVVIACGFFIPKWLREGLRLGAINLHPSLLPELRGAAPVNWAIIRGYEKTGITVFKLVKEMDAGPILSQEETVIGENETAGQLLERLSEAGAKLIATTIKLYSAGKLTPLEQDETRVTYAPKITREVCAIDWAKPAQDVYNLFRGLAPRPGVHFAFCGENIKIAGMLLVKNEDIQGRYSPGEVIEVVNDCLRVACAVGAVDLSVVRPPGKGDMSGEAFTRGRGMGSGVVIK
jgi:methionyl-tRNA formyltransferase